ncbi:MAG: aminoglycoside phosphotransferase family protein [Chloroflexi bacterium]|nr:aminoglycoside phosphotransferase family protein [Chloroflexota bacterium]
MSERLRRLLPSASDLQAIPTYVRYKPGTSCLVAYEVQRGDHTEDLYAKAFTVGSPKLRNAAVHSGESTGTPRVPHVWEDIATHVSGPASDHDLKSLARMCDPQQRHELFQRLLPEGTDFWDARVKRLRYKPERRYVAQLTTPAGAHALLKVYHAEDFLRAYLGASVAVMQQLSPTSAMLAKSQRYHILVFRWARGQTLLEQLLTGSVDVSTIERLGERLVQLHLHTVPDADLPWLTPTAMAERLYAAAQSVAAVCPPFADQAARLVRRISTRLPLVDVPTRYGMIHGDFKPDQVMCGDGEVTLLDFDQACQGDYAADLGSFAAQLEHGALMRTWSMADVGQVMTRLIRCYSHLHDATLERRVRLYTAAGLLLLAPHEFRNRTPDWIATTSTVLDRSERLISYAG